MLEPLPPGRGWTESTAQRDSIHGTPTRENTNSTPAFQVSGHLEVVVKPGQGGDGGIGGGNGGGDNAAPEVWCEWLDA